MIAYAMLYATAVGLPILVAAVVGSAFLRRHGRAERGVWLTAVVLTLGVPLIMLSRPPVAVPTPWTPVLESVALDLAPVLVLPAVTEIPPAIALEDLLIALWLLASVSLASRWIVSSFRLSRMRRSWRTEMLDGLSVSLAPHTGPGVFGIVRPRIVVPSWVATLPSPDRALVLGHEQEHLRGGDHWLAAISRVSRIFAPWHPLVWLLTSRLARAMELDCDRRVLRRHPDVAHYGATLLLVAARGSSELLAAAGFAESDVSLRRRILAMTTPPRALSAVGLVAATTLGVALLTGALEIPVPAIDAPVVRLAGALQVRAPVMDEAADAEPVVATFATALAPPVAAPVAPVLSSSETQAQQALAEPRVIANPVGRRMVASVLREDSVLLDPPDALAPGLAPGPRIILLPSPTNPDTLVFVGAIRLGPEILNPAMARAALAAQFGESVRWGIGFSPASPSDPAPDVTVAPRILNPDEISAAIERHYPLELRTQNLGGTVGVQFAVGQTGAVQQMRIGQRSAFPELDEAALRVAETYLFSPALLDDQPVAVWVSHAVGFWP